MAPSPPKKEVGKRIKVEARKEKRGEPSEAEEARPRRQRSIYTIAESLSLGKSWVDITEDAITANNQDVGGYWGVIKASYNQIVPPLTGPEHKKGYLCKHWERIMRECGRFNAIYRSDMDHMANGHNEFSIREQAMATYCAQYNVKLLKYWPVYENLKEIPKFRMGMETVMQGRSVRNGPDRLVNVGPQAKPMGRTRAKTAHAAKRKGKAGRIERDGCHAGDRYRQ